MFTQSSMCEVPSQEKQSLLGYLPLYSKGSASHPVAVLRMKGYRVWRERSNLQQEAYTT